MSPSASYPRSSLQTTLILNLIFSMPLCAPLYSAASSISAGRPLSGDRTITSGGGNFELGFFAPGKSPKFYIGIWYKKDSSRKPVWVANRETPVHDPSSSELRISGDGNLVLLNEAGNLIWSTNATSKTTKSTAAELLDTGNFILRDGYNSSKLFWQSFDHPTDTWLPGGKLGLNKVTGVAQRLISWKNSEDPAPGIYSHGLDPNGSSQFFLTWNASVTFWSSGEWNGRTFGNMPEMVRHFIYDFEFVSNDEESYFTYSSIRSGMISRSVMDISGRLTQFMWLDNLQQWAPFWSEPKAQCDVYHLCGPFGICIEKSSYCSCTKGFEEASRTDWNLGDFRGGCTRRTPFQCESRVPDRDRFYPLLNMKLPNNSHPLAAAQSAGECESACLSNCSCAAYSYNDGCILWHHGLFDMQQLSSGAQSGETLHLRLAAMELPNPKPIRRQAIAIAVGAAIGVLSAAFTFVWLLIRRHRRRQFSKLKLVEGSLVLFKYSELKRVTRSFSEKLGRGGFGSVFKGTMPDSTQVAVKKLEGIGQGEKQFRTEVSVIGTVQHVNLVRLRGFCSERSRRLLVYDYMPGGSLDNVLFRNTAQVLSWTRRYQIMQGIARGLTYLHEKCRDCIIHCDIKPENILLDASLMPKVADFGLAKLVGRDFSRVLTTMRGTIGYLAPEWISGTAITAKVDVYSFGMMLFEIVSGRRNSVEHEEEKFGFFPVWAARKLMEGAVLSLLDPRLEGEADLEDLNRVLKVAYWCIQDDEAFRPSMGQVVQILEGVLDVDMPPIPRYLLFLAEGTGDTVFSSNVSSYQSSSRMPPRDVSASSQRNEGEAHPLQMTHEAA